MTTERKPMDEWKDLPWKKIEREVFKLQKRIYRASQRDDVRTVRKLQKLLVNSRSAQRLAVRKVTQDNQGKRTAGVDGIKSLHPRQRLELANDLKLEKKPDPVRRVGIPKAGTDEKRGLGIPTIPDRALQSLVRLVLEPEWEAKFEPHRYGFRPGRSCHDAIGAIFQALCQQSKWTLDADIAKCFDQIDHRALLKKINTSPTIQRQLKAWLKAGVLNGGELSPTEKGVPQGGTISPLLMNIALHGLETMTAEKFPENKRKTCRSPIVVKYADDLVILHKDLAVIQQCQAAVSEWLKEIGLELKPSKTRIVPTLEKSDAGVGFDFLGFNVRQYRAGKTQSARNPRGKLLGFKTLIKPSPDAIKRQAPKLRETVRRNRAADPETLINTLNPIIVGWSNYYATVVSKKTFAKMGTLLFARLLAWATRRHPKKNQSWVVHEYWRRERGQWIFQPRNRALRLRQHRETRIQRHVKVQSTRSPLDGDWIYWSKRLGRHPEISPRMAKLLQRQQGKCPECGLFFKEEDLLEVDHIRPKERGGRDAYFNWQVLHRHCHDVKTARDTAVKRYA